MTAKGRVAQESIAEKIERTRLEQGLDAEPSDDALAALAAIVAAAVDVDAP